MKETIQEIRSCRDCPHRDAEMDWCNHYHEELGLFGVKPGFCNVVKVTTEEAE